MNIGLAIARIQGAGKMKGDCKCKLSSKDHKPARSCGICGGNGTMTLCDACGGAGFNAAKREACASCGGRGYKLPTGLPA